jgi:hypothetical protein
LWPAVRTSAFSPFYSSLTNFAFPPRSSQSPSHIYELKRPPESGGLLLSKTGTANV